MWPDGISDSGFHFLIGSHIQGWLETWYSVPVFSVTAAGCVCFLTAQCFFVLHSTSSLAGQSTLTTNCYVSPR